jgi:hypothetical protein
LSLSAAPIASAAQRADLQPTGSARITGGVLASDNGRRVRRAAVRLSGNARTLERLRPLAVPVTLAAGETAKVEVGVRRQRRGRTLRTPH